MKRRCEKCPADVQAVCRHAFGKYWDGKSDGGKGCDHPLDDAAEAWRKTGWTPDKGVTKTITLPLPSKPTMPRRPVRPPLPKVSAEIMRQANLFFGRAGK